MVCRKALAAFSRWGDGLGAERMTLTGLASTLMTLMPVESL